MERTIKMEYIINLIAQNEVVVEAAIGIFVAIVWYLIKKIPPTPQESAVIKGVSDKVVDILLLIFSHTQYNHAKFNATLKEPVILLPTIPTSEQKMKVAVQAIKEQIEPKLVNKAIKRIDQVSDVVTFAQHAYKILKPFFKKK